MQLSKETKYLLIGAVILCILYWLYKKNSTPVKNDGTVDDTESVDDESHDDKTNSLPGDDESVPTTHKSTPHPTTKKATSKKTTKKSTNKPTTKKATTKRSTSKPVAKKPDGEWTQLFEMANDILNVQNDGGFAPMENNTQFATFKSTGDEKDLSPEELFNSARYLPQEVNDDWFEVPHEPVSIKNRHLIQTVRPESIDSIATSQKNATWDIRGNEACPKFVVSPWMNSSIEPDYNIRSWCKK